MDCSVTRRTVGRLLYAAPLVAATMPLHRRRAMAHPLCNHTCAVSPYQPGCANPRGIDCAGGDFTACSDSSACVLIDTVEGDVCCVSIFGCGPACASTDDCQSWRAGSLCQAPGTGCCGQVCIPACGDAVDDPDCPPDCRRNLPPLA